MNVRKMCPLQNSKRNELDMGQNEDHQFLVPTVVEVYNANDIDYTTRLVYLL